MADRKLTREERNAKLARIRKDASPDAESPDASQSLTAQELATRLERGSQEPKLTHEQVWGHPLPAP